MLECADEPGQIQVAAIAPGMIEHLRDEYVLAAAHRVRVDTDERQDAGRRRLHALAVEVRVPALGGGGRGERLQQGQWPARVAARRIDGHVDTVPQARDAGAVLPPVREAVLP